MKVLKVSAQLMLFMFVCNASSAQEEVQWKFVQEKESIRLFFALSSCGGENKLMLMVVNTDAAPKRVAVKLQLIDTITPQDLPEGIFHVPANGVFVMDCQNTVPHLQALSVNVVHDDASLAVSSIEIANL